MRLLIATPTYVGLLPKSFLHSLLCNVRFLTEKGIRVDFASTERTFVHKAQNTLARKAFEMGADLFFLEEDVILRGEDFIWRAIQKPSMIVCGPQADRNGEKKICLFGTDYRPLDELKEPTEVAICHTGATLIRKEVLDAVLAKFPDPFEAEARIELVGKDGTVEKVVRVINDGSFMHKARMCGMFAWAYPDLRVFHIGNRIQHTYDDNGYSSK